jgi:hypothetical protein
VRSAVKDEEMREDEAIHRLSRSSHGVWTAIALQSKRLVALAVGPRTRAMAQRLVPQVVSVYTAAAVGGTGLTTNRYSLAAPEWP